MGLFPLWDFICVYSLAMKLQKLVQECMKVDYIPKVEKENWDYINEAIWMGIHNEVQLNALFIIVKMFSPLKIIVKILLKSYLKACVEES